jgi:hypothetical protein
MSVYQLDDQCPFPRMDTSIFSQGYRVQTASGTRQAFCPIDIAASLPGDKAAGA